MKKHLLVTGTLIALSACGGAETDDKKSSGGTGVDSPNKISLSKATTEIKEGDTQAGSVALAIVASKVAESPIDIFFKTTNGTAITGVDYSGQDGKVTIPKGSKTAEITLSTIANTIHQNDRDFKLSLTEIKSTSGKLELGLNETIVKINDDDPEPNLQFGTAKVTTHENVGDVGVPVVMDRQSSKETQFRVTVAGTATNGSDFSMKTLDFKVPSMAATFNLPVTVLPDSLVEGTEKIDLTISQVVNGKLGQNKTLSILISGDLKLPDTAVTTFYNNGNILSKSPDSAHPYQDAAYGLDTDPNYKPNGDAGFVYTKIDNAGNALSNTSATHSCVMDNHTGLTWEVKSDAQPTYVENPRKKDTYIELMHPQSQNAVYLWNNPDPKTNGGSVGGINKLEFEVPEIPGSSNCSFPTKTSPLYSAEVSVTGCTSEQYVKYINRAALCGHKDWRLPSINELLTIASYMPGQLIHDAAYFSDAQSHMWGNPATIRYLSATPSSENDASVWCLDVDYKKVMLCNKQTYNSLRLVRGSKL